MRQTVDAAFGKLDENLNLEPAVRRKAQHMHNAIRDELAVAGIVAGSFLQGSFARKTMLKPLKDVDIVCLLPAVFWEQVRGPDGPQVAMDWFKGPIKKRWPDVEFDVGDAPSGKALRLSFPGCEFTIDLVPAFETAGGLVLIGDRHEGTWTPSNTRVQLEKVSDRNQQTNGRFVHQVRELKQLTKHHPELDFVKGIVVESLAFAVIRGKLLDKDAVAGVLRHASIALAGAVMEPAGDDDVVGKWSAEERAVAMRVYGDCARRAAEALRLEQAGDVDGAIDLWGSVFGDVFPPAPIRSAQDTMAAWAAGSVSSSGRPSSSRVGRQPAAPGRSWSRER